MINISSENWEVLREKFKRKYNHLSDDDLRYTTGEEEELVERLARLVRRDKRYIEFTLAKEQSNLSSNRL